MTMLDKCKSEFILITRQDYDETNPVHVSIVEDMVKFRDNQIDNLGLTSIALNGISESYAIDYPAYILRQLNTLKKRVIFL